VVDGLERDLAGKVTFLRLNIQEEAGARVAAAHGVTRVPSFLAFRDGELVLRAEGRGGADALARALRGRE
jgi:thioredoxin-like negative regulator of GroEL